jgi:hypothetical protein
VSPTVRWLARGSAVGIVVFCAGLWVYVFLIADPKPTDRLSSPAFARAAGPVCKTAKDQIYAAGLYGAKAETPQQRGDISDRADTILRSMVEQLKRVAPTEGEDARVVAGWLADWDTFLADRDAWVRQLESGDGSAFYEHSHEGGEPASKTMDAFTVANAIEDCKSPDNY